MIVALALIQWLHVGAAMLLFGAGAFLDALARGTLAARLDPARRRASRLTAALLLATGLGWLALQTGLMADGARAAIDPATLADVLDDTAFGHAWLLHLGLVAILAGAIFVELRPWIATILSGLVLASIGLVGHPTMHEGLVGVLHRVNQAAHLLAAGAWLGSLVPLMAIMSYLADPVARVDSAAALRRFSVAGHWVVALILVTGIFNTALVLGTVLPDTSTVYGRLLLAKLLGVAAMVWLALWNRYILVPALRAAPAESLRQLKRLTTINIGVGATILLVSAALSLADPTASAAIG